MRLRYPARLNLLFVVAILASLALPSFASAHDDCNAVIWTDTPTENQTVAGTARFGGWALDLQEAVFSSGIENVHLYLDGEAGSGGTFIGQANMGNKDAATSRADLVRPDVDVVFSRTNNRAGWVLDVDLSRFTVGRHAVYVYAETHCGWIFSRFNINIDPAAPIVAQPVTTSGAPYYSTGTGTLVVRIDSPSAGTEVSGTRTISGVAANCGSGAAAPASVRIYEGSDASGQLLGTATLSGRDLSTVCSGRSGGADIAFSYSLNTRRLSDRNETIAAVADWGSGVTATGTTTLYVRNYDRGYSGYGAYDYYGDRVGYGSCRQYDYRGVCISYNNAYNYGYGYGANYCPPGTVPSGGYYGSSYTPTTFVGPYTYYGGSLVNYPFGYGNTGYTNTFPYYGIYPYNAYNNYYSNYYAGNYGNSYYGNSTFCATNPSSPYCYGGSGYYGNYYSPYLSGYYGNYYGTGYGTGYGSCLQVVNGVCVGSGSSYYSPYYSGNYSGYYGGLNCVPIGGGVGYLPITYAPTSVSASATSSTTATVLWTQPVVPATIYAISGYRVEVAPTANPNTIVATVNTTGATATTATVTGLTAATSYTVRVRTMFTNGALSEPSNPVTFTTP